MVVSLYMLVGLCFFLGGSYMAGLEYTNTGKKAFRHAWILAVFSPAWPVALAIYLAILASRHGEQNGNT